MSEAFPADHHVALSRVVISHDGEAVRPNRARAQGIEPAVVFIRDDRWSLGAPGPLAWTAFQTWRDRWTHYMAADEGWAVKPIAEHPFVCDLENALAALTDVVEKLGPRLAAHNHHGRGFTEALVLHGVVDEILGRDRPTSAPPGPQIEDRWGVYDAAREAVRFILGPRS